jgi:N-acetylated-alpha-linked acidic dipeptidase
MLLLLAALAAAPAAGPRVDRDVPVPMRDGVRLFADVMRPAGEGRFPTLVYRTPYDRRGAAREQRVFARALERGYAVVLQDVRGRHGSEGEFVPYRQEGRDGYDTIEWAAAQPWSDGRVGTLGLSYPGAVQWLAALEAPPHLEAMVPAMTFSGPDNFFHVGGSFDLSWIDWILKNIAPDVRVRKNLAGPRRLQEAEQDLRERSHELRARLPLDALHELRDVAPYYFEWLSHPAADPWWDWSRIRGRYDRVGVAVLNLSGWHDEAYGPEGAITNFDGLVEARRGEPDPRTQLVLGPWVHGGLGSSRSGDREFGVAAPLDYPDLVLRFFDRYLRGREVDTGPRVRAFVMGENVWRSGETWPLPGTRPVTLHLAAAGRLKAAAPGTGEPPSAFVSDPARPVTDPYADEPGAHDYRELARRSDVLCFETEPFAEALRVVGTVRAELFLSADAPDADVWLKLYDVAPDGTAFNVTSHGFEVVRASLAGGGPERRALAPGEVRSLRFGNQATGNLFKSGHRLRVVLSGSFAPHFSRNLQTGESEVGSAALKPATLRIHHDASHPSRLELPVLPDAAAVSASSPPAASAKGPAQERRLVERISTARLSGFHEMLTRRPHVAGTDGGRDVAAAIAEALEGMGFTTRRSDYEPYLSYPKALRVSLTRPEVLELPVRERSDPLDPDTAHPDLLPGFVAYSASGRVRAPVVYANYGLPPDFAALEERGVRVAGSIVLARYGKVHRAVKVHGAETRGAAGILIYSDPADDGDARGDPWPRGPWRAAWFLQRGNAKYSWHWHGDPLTPFVAATRDAVRLAPAEAATLPRIPAAVLSSAAGQEILSRLSGPAAPPGFQGALPFTYRVGAGPAEVELRVEMDSGRRPIVNVTAQLDGADQPDRVVLLGTHHDAWTFGGVDPGSAGAAILELARVLADLRREGWRPRRSLRLGFWDAEEFGLIGSTEYAEEHAQTLREQVVAYVNSDLYRTGRLEAKGSASLRDFVVAAARDVRHPDGEGTLDRDLKAELEPLGSGADFVPFQMFLGIPALSFEFGPLGGYGSYHSAYDTRRYMERHGDPGWTHGRALVELLGRVLLRLVDGELLPLRPSGTAKALRGWLDALAAGPDELEGVREALDRFEQQADSLESDASAALARGTLDRAGLRSVNDALCGAEKAFADPESSPSGLEGVPRRWYRHTLYGWNIHALYGGDTLPALRRELAEGGGAGLESARLERVLRRASAELELGRAALERSASR